MNSREFFLLSIFIIFDLANATPCTVESTGMDGDCMFMTDCPVVLNDYQRFRKMPTLCDKKYRTVCCPKKVSTSTTTSTESPKRISERMCRDYGRYVYETETVPNPIFGEPPIEKKQDKCAHSSVELIVGGEEARDREFPHMALIGYKEGKIEDYQCGGSLISEQWVLSAAHCGRVVDGPAKFVKLGNVRRDKENSNTWTYNIIQRVLHPKYSSRLATDDIALFKLENSARLNKYIIPICLPQTGDQTTKKAIASGWGRTGFAQDVSEKLMKVTIEFFDQNRCNAIYEDEEKLNGQSIDFSKMICAGSTNKTGDTCNGDSGGPLQIFNSQIHCMYTIVGVTSFGSVYCGAVGIPAIYTKVFFYLDWIESIVWPNQ